MERAYTEMLIMAFSVLRDYGFLPLCFSVFPKFAGLNMLLFFFFKIHLFGNNKELQFRI